jgi:biopolymer transport protein ExbB
VTALRSTRLLIKETIMRRLSSLFLLCVLCLSGAAQAWWNADWSYRKPIKLNTSDTGAATREAIAPALIAVRLNTGNFGFLDAKADGSDLRFIAGDDKTPLKFHIERFDPTNELAVVWVQVPRVSGGSTGESIWLYYGNEKAPAGEDAKGSFDTPQLLSLHLSDAAGSPRDATAYAHHATESNAKLGAAGVLAGAASFDGTQRIVIAPVPSLAAAADAGATITAWVRATDAAANATVLAFGDAAKAQLVLGLNQGRPVARVIAGGRTVEAAAPAAISAGNWSHLAVVFGGGRLALIVDGKEAATAAAPGIALAGPVVIGAGLRGEIDEVTLAAVARPLDAIRLAFASQGAAASLLAYGEAEQDGGGGGAHSHMGVLVDALTVDAWVVIIICGLMLVLAIWIMITKTIYIARMDGDNQRFLAALGKAGGDLTALENAGAQFPRSSLFRLYRIGMAEVKRRLEAPPAAGRYASVGAQAAVPVAGHAVDFSAQTLGAIRSTVSGGLVRENHGLNAYMVMLTIAISGGPFLGLLGTVIGVMITFAAVAAAGDVNVNAIAPGIAAALLATCAGLAVAIPALFGYNYLATRIKAVNADMQVFVEELMSRIAERYSS